MLLAIALLSTAVVVLYIVFMGGDKPFNQLSDHSNAALYECHLRKGLPQSYIHELQKRKKVILRSHKRHGGDVIVYDPITLEIIGVIAHKELFEYVGSVLGQGASEVNAEIFELTSRKSATTTVVVSVEMGLQNME